MYIIPGNRRILNEFYGRGCGYREDRVSGALLQLTVGSNRCGILLAAS